MSLSGRSSILAGAAAIVVVLLAAAPAVARPLPTCGSPDGAAPDALGRPGPDLAWRAELVASTKMFKEPAGPGARRSISPRQASSLLVLGARRDRRGDCRLRVRLPWRPNGATGWVRAGAVTLHATQWRLEISRRGRTITVYRGDLRVKEFAVVVGKASTPTPAGLFSILGVWRGDPAGFSGAWILTLSAHSDALRHFEGGNGRVAIHGRGGASLLDPLGSARSHGCIRLANPAIEWLVRQVGAAELPGVPVTVRP